MPWEQWERESDWNGGMIAGSQGVLHDEVCAVGKDVFFSCGCSKRFLGL